MKSLAIVLREKNFNRALYFCGDHHRKELSQHLTGVPVFTKVISYKSSQIYPVITKRYDVILIFSPRSAQSLLRYNTFSPNTVFGCIGPTTESYLHGQGISNTFCASSPDSEVLLKELSDRYKK